MAVLRCWSLAADLGGAGLLPRRPASPSHYRRTHGDYFRLHVEQRAHQCRRPCYFQDQGGQAEGAEEEISLALPLLASLESGI